MIKINQISIIKNNNGIIIPHDNNIMYACDENINETVKKIIDEGYKIIISDVNISEIIIKEAFDTNNINIFNKSTLSEQEYNKILNHVNLYIIYPVPNVYIGLVKNLTVMFNKKSVCELFLKNGLKIITSNNVAKYYGTYIFQEILDKYILNNSIIFIIKMHGSHMDIKVANAYFPCDYVQTSYAFPKNKTIKTKNIKIVGWQDDLHVFSEFSIDRQKKNIMCYYYNEIYDSLILNNIDWLITPSYIYLQNLKMEKYIKKTTDLFYMLNPNDFNNIKYVDYNDRKPQIVLSGIIGGGYINRVKFSRLQNTDVNFKRLIFSISHPGYNSGTNEHMTGLNYYNTLALYKGAFVASYAYPVNFLVAKHLEVLMCGCLGFFEKNVLLESQLGLKEFEHYIPTTTDDNNLITNHCYYEEWLNSEKGKQIAENGKKYVIEKFGESYIINYLNVFKQFL